MTICNFFLQGRCRFGDKCWNEHPRDGRQHAQNRYQQQPHHAAGSSTGQRYVQPSSFSKSTTWTNRDNDKTSFGSFSGSSDRSRNFKPNSSSGFFSSQNQYSVLANQDNAKDIQTDKEGSLLDEILLDLEIWVSSGQWQFSVYSVLKEKCLLSGFTDVSPEEMRLECYTSQKEGNIQNYVNSVQQLVSQWKRRIHEIRNINPASKSSLLKELTRPSSDPTPTFGGLQKSGFGASNFPTNSAVPSAAAFSFKPDSVNTAPNAETSSSVPSAAAFGNKPTSGFGNTMTAASFSFAKTSSSSFGASAFSGFGSTPTAQGMEASSSAPSGFGGLSMSTGTTGTTGFGSSASATSAFGGASNSSVFGGLAGTSTTSAFGLKTTAVSDLFKAGAMSSAPSVSLFGQGPGVSVSSTPSNTAVTTSTSDTSSALFTPQAELSAEDLMQFSSKKFTLGKIPLLPPPADLLFV
ncbi:nucleoporin NUP42-like [Mixophyes fleayi]|uniref:nucleoporin NUP42-like n=1 Tax=Mixophyes fleayi TaxID=3061075 RepID=UPI003F4E348A